MDNDEEFFASENTDAFPDATDKSESYADYAARLTVWKAKQEQLARMADAPRQPVQPISSADLRKWEAEHGFPQPVPTGYHGRFDMLSVDDIKWLAAMQIDPIEEAPPDTRIWKPREAS